MRNYIFFTNIFELVTDTKRNINGNNGIRLLKGLESIQNLLKAGIITEHIGTFEFEEFFWEDSLIYVARGKVENFDEKDECKLGNKLVRSLMDEAESFLNELWLRSDNSGYIRDGYLIVYENVFDDGFLYRFGKISRPTSSNLKTKNISEDVLREALRSFERVNTETINIKMDTLSIGNFDPLASSFMQKKIGQPVERALFNVVNARYSSLIPIKIIYYCSALEALFGFGEKGEVAHKVAERTAIFLRDEEEKRLNLFELIKKAYNFRSIILHGSYLKEKNINQLEELSSELDSLLREILSNSHRSILNNQKGLKNKINHRLFS